MTFSGIDHNLHSTVKLKMSKNSVKTILITLYLSAVQDPEPLSLHMFSPHPEVIIEQVGVDGGLQVEGGRDKTLSSDLGLAGVAFK